MNKFALALILSTVATTATAHPLAEKHTRENIAKYYKLDLTPEVVEKEKIVVKEVPVEVEKEINAWGVISLNTIAMDGESEDFSYVELEGGVTVGNLDVYGFFDVNDNESVFYKLNPKYYVFGSNVYVNYTLKGFHTSDSSVTVPDMTAGNYKVPAGKYDTNFSEVNNYVGVGYTFRNDSGGAYSASFNVRHTDVEHEIDGYNAGYKGENGYAVLTTLYQPISQDKSWTMDGWVEYSFDQQEEFSNGNDSELRGNVGVRKTFANGMYGRVAYHFLKNDDDKVATDFDGAHLQIGYNF